MLALAYARSLKKLCGLKTVHVIGRLPVLIEDLKLGGSRFRSKAWFKIAVHDTYRRIRAAVDDGPSPPDMPEPKVSRQQTTPPKHVGPATGGRSRNDVKGIRAVADRLCTKCVAQKARDRRP